MNDVGQNMIDALVNNHLKKAIDKTIENSLGKRWEYSALKKQYAQLRNIENEVAKRALVDQRKNAKGLVDFTDMYTAGQFVDAIATFNPVSMARGVTSGLLKNWYKRLNDPNRAIQKLFENVDKEVNSY